MNVPILSLPAVLAIGMIAAASAAAADFDAPSYHDSQCTRCHDSGVYTRANRRVRSYPMLDAQVARCDANLASKLFPEDLQLLTDHLNDSYYHFAK